MTRTVIRLEESVDSDGRVRVNFRPEEPADVSERMRWRTLGCMPGDAPFSDLAAILPGPHVALQTDIVLDAGKAIHAALSAHPGVAEALNRAASTAPGDRHPIQLLTSALDAESFPWEAMHHPSGHFLGLDPRFAIARAVSTGGSMLERLYEAPLRLVALLAASDREAGGEWHALENAVMASGMAVQLTVYVAHDALETEILAANHPWVAVRRVPPTKDELLGALQNVQPHIVHVYSHGSAQGGFLEIATPGSVAGFGDPPIYLEARHLATLRNHVWLITLDACEGARPAQGVHSIAHTLVESGVPAAVGMREMIDSTDVNVFCRAFYSAALSELNATLKPGTSATPNWAAHVATAREALCARLPGAPGMNAYRQKPWTLPVLYRRGEELVVRTPGPAADLDAENYARKLGELEVFRRALSELHPDNPGVVRQQLEALIAQREAFLFDAVGV